MSSVGDGTRNYFNRIPDKWDALYSHRSGISSLVNRLFRQGLFHRNRLTFEHCGEISGAAVLDIGCGTGQYSVEFASRGASRVVGIDFAPSMIEFSRDLAEKRGVSSICEFVCDDFSTFRVEESFDIVVAVGFFDYIKEPGPILRKIAGLTPNRFLASFPRNGPIWQLQRTIRYKWIKGCPIYEYTRSQLEGLYSETGFNSVNFHDIGSGIFVVASKEETE